MDATIPVMIDSELATDMVKLLGEELKKLKAKNRSLEKVRISIYSVAC